MQILGNNGVRGSIAFPPNWTKGDCKWPTVDLFSSVDCTPYSMVCLGAGFFFFNLYTLDWKIMRISFWGQLHRSDKWGVAETVHQWNRLHLELFQSWTDLSPVDLLNWLLLFIFETLRSTVLCSAPALLKPYIIALTDRKSAEFDAGMISSSKETKEICCLSLPWTPGRIAVLCALQIAVNYPIKFVNCRYRKRSSNVCITKMTFGYTERIETGPTFRNLLHPTIIVFFFLRGGITITARQITEWVKLNWYSPNSGNLKWSGTGEGYTAE